MWPNGPVSDSIIFPSLIQRSPGSKTRLAREGSCSCTISSCSPPSVYLHQIVFDVMSASDSVVAMHPTASRTRQVVAPAPAELDLDRLEAGQTFPPLPPLPHEDHTHSAWSTPLPPSPTVSSPTLGLASHADSFPDLNLSTPLSSFAGRWTAGTAVSSGNIKVVTAAQYAALQYEANNLVLPERILFPWSHGGADVVDSPAANYFGFERGQSARTPK